MIKTDILVIGSGAAGMSAAIKLSENFEVTLVTKNSLIDSSTWYAQGGIAAVIDDNDTIEEHLRDTLIAGDGLCNETAVRECVSHGEEAINWLASLGTNFTQDKSSENFHLTQEGGHSKRRVVHAEDATGKEVSSSLSDIVRSISNIKILENHIVVDLITHENNCIGAYVLDIKANAVKAFTASSTILATGGASKVYLYTSNPDGSSGDGIGLAWRAGCIVENLEFNQFHPTCLYHPHAGSFLVSEAVRGEGGVLRLPSGERFMHKFDERAELAPRDIVARAIDHEMKRIGADCVYLDISHRSHEFIQHHFPNIAKKCSELGIDISKEPIPVVPAAHYTCGGVVVDEHGRTDLANLYAIGEVSCTGLHGANRLASNSLLECLVYGQNAAEKIISQLDRPQTVPYIPRWDESQVTDSDESIIIAHNWEELRRFMWDYVGIVRTDKRLQRAQRRIELLKQEIHEYYANYRVTNDLIELRNLLHVADLIVRSALKRKESRGLNYNLDHPEQTVNTTDTILFPGSTDQLDMIKTSV